MTTATTLTAGLPQAPHARISAGPAAPVVDAPLASARRVRLGIRAVLTLAVAASITANVLHAQPSTVGRAIAAWPPLALLLTVELISRVPVHSRRLSALRVAATTAIAGIAAWVSYWHMVDVAHTHGETQTSAHLIPLSVDGLVVVASICLVEIGARLRALAPLAVPARTATTERADVLHTPEHQHESHDEVEDRQHDIASEREANAAHNGTRRSGERAHDKGAQQARRPATNTAEAIARLTRRHPDWSAAQVAARLGVHPSTVRRHLNARPITDPTGTRTSEALRTDASASASSDPRTATSTQTRTGARTGTSGRTRTATRGTTSTDTSTDPTTEGASADAPAA